MVLRDVALDPMVFKGLHANRHREFAELEDEELLSFATRCRETADDWARAWARAVDEFNDEAEQVARVRMRWFDQVRRISVEGPLDLIGPTVVTTPGSVVPASAAPVPLGPTFTVENSFVDYDFGFDDLVAWPRYRATS